MADLCQWSTAMPPVREWLTLGQAIAHLPPHVPENDLRSVEHHFEDGRVIFDHAGLHGYIAARPAPDTTPLMPEKAATYVDRFEKQLLTKHKEITMNAARTGNDAGTILKPAEKYPTIHRWMARGEIVDAIDLAVELGAALAHTGGPALASAQAAAAAHRMEAADA